MTSSAFGVAPEPFVGRARELTRLRGLVAATAAGRGGWVLVAGEPGVGKSRLVQVLAAEATSAVTVVWGYARDGEGIPALRPWTEVLRAVVAAHPGALDVLGGARADLRPALPELDGPAAPKDPEMALAALHDAVWRVLVGVAATAPVVVVLEDLHWADQPTADVLAFLAPAMATQAVLLVGTVRDEEVGEGHPLADLLGTAAGRGALLPVGGLDRAHVGELLDQLVGGSVDDAVASAVYDRTGGNPFLVAEVARLGVPAIGQTVPIPRGARQLIERRTARLTSACHRLLQVAALIGEVVDDGLLLTAAGLPPADGLALLEEAERSGLLADEGAGRHRFAHALVRGVLADSASGATRARLSLAIADALHARPRPGDDGWVAAVAHHLQAAGVLADQRQLADALLDAGRRATAALDHAVAADHLGRAVAVLEQLGGGEADGIRAAALVELAAAEVRRGDLPAARASCAAAADLARRLGRADLLAQAALWASGGTTSFEVPLHDPAALDLVREALAALGDEPSDVRPWLLARLSVASSYITSVEERAALAAEAVAAARAAGDPAALVTTLATRCDAMATPEHVDARLEMSAEMLAAAPDPEAELLARRFRVVALLERGDVHAVDLEIAAFAQVAEAQRQPRHRWFVPLWRGMRAAMRGDLEGAARLADEAARIGEAAHSLNARMLSTSLRVEIAARRDDLGEVEALWPTLPGWVLDLPQARMAIIGFRARCGSGAGADDVLDWFSRSGLQELDRDAEWLNSLVLAAHAAALVAHRPAAEVLHEAMRPHADLLAVDGIAAACPCPVSTALGLTAATLGRRADAAAHLQAAVRTAQRIGAPLLAAAAERELGALGGAAPPAPPPRRTTAALRRQGRVWTLEFDGATAQLRDSKGVHDLAVLLANPGVEVRAEALVAGGTAAAASGAGDLPARTGFGGDPVLDARARDAYRRRLQDLTDDVEEAQAAHDTERAARARAELDALTDALASAYGLHGRPRRLGDDAERARKAVTWRIRAAIRAVEEALPPAGRHLRAAVRTGSRCRYEPEQPRTWEVLA